MPYLRGYGTTRFLSNDTFRNGQQSVVALDITALMDALKIQTAIITGHAGYGKCTHRFREAHLAAGVPEVELRRRDV